MPFTMLLRFSHRRKVKFRFPRVSAYPVQTCPEWVSHSYADHQRRFKFRLSYEENNKNQNKMSVNYGTFFQGSSFFPVLSFQFLVS